MHGVSADSTNRNNTDYYKNHSRTLTLDTKWKSFPKTIARAILDNCVKGLGVWFKPKNVLIQNISWNAKCKEICMRIKHVARAWNILSEHSEIISNNTMTVTVCIYIQWYNLSMVVLLLKHMRRQDRKERVCVWRIEDMEKRVTNSIRNDMHCILHEWKRNIEAKDGEQIMKTHQWFYCP